MKEIHEKIYRREGTHIAFYSPEKNTVFISVEDVGLKVFAHELAHVVIEHY